MKRTGSDYWKLYHDDFWDDPDVLPLSEGEAGIYVYLLGIQAKHGYLPGSDGALDAIGRRFKTWPKVWPKLQKFFPIEEDGHRRNPRQAFELSEIDAKREKATDRKSRYRASKRQLSTGTGTGQGRGRDGDVPQVSHDRGEERREEEKRISPPPPSGGVDSGKRRRSVRIDPETYPLPDSLDLPSVRLALIDYLNTRKGGVWNEALAAVRVREMAEWGPERAIAALKHSAGYQGLFEPTGNGRAPIAPQAPSKPLVLTIDTPEGRAAYEAQMERERRREAAQAERKARSA